MEQSTRDSFENRGNNRTRETRLDSGVYHLTTRVQVKRTRSSLYAHILIRSMPINTNHFYFCGFLTPFIELAIGDFSDQRLSRNNDSK